MKKKAFLIVFDRDDEVDYKKLHRKIISIQEITNWWHYIKSCYLVVARINSATALNKKILEIFPKGKNIIVIEVSLRNVDGLLHPRAWEWIERNAETIE